VKLKIFEFHETPFFCSGKKRGAVGGLQRRSFRPGTVNVVMFNSNSFLETLSRRYPLIVIIC
jgi:hypothetical protein